VDEIITLDELKKKYDIVYGKHRIDWIRSHCPRNKKIVDIGGNTGHTFNGYDRKFVTTVDLDVYQVENFVRSNAEDLPFKDREFDIAVFAEILEHVDNPEIALLEAKRVSKKLIISVPFEHFWGSDLRPFHLFETIVEENNGNLLNEAVKGNPTCIDFYKEDNHRHLFHHRFFTPQTLEELLIKVFGCVDYMCILENNSMWCIGAIIE